MIQTNHAIHFAHGNRGKRQSRSGKKKSAEAGRVPHVAKLMALAIRLDQLIREGAVADQAELARLGHVSRARLTQIQNLLHLSAEIQEEVLFLPLAKCGRDTIIERQLRPIAATPCWRKQRQMWKSIQNVARRDREQPTL